MIWRGAWGAAKLLGVAAACGAPAPFRTAGAARRRPAIRVVAGRPSGPVLCWVDSMAAILEFVAEQFQIACIALGNAVNQLLVVILAVVAAARRVDLVEATRRNADPSGDVVVG